MYSYFGDTTLDLDLSALKRKQLLPFDVLDGVNLLERERAFGSL